MRGFIKIIKLLALSFVTISVVACSNLAMERNNSYENRIYEITNQELKAEGITQTVKEVGVFTDMVSAANTYNVCNQFIKDEDKDKTTVVVKIETKNESDYMVSTFTSVRPFVTNRGEIVKSLKSNTYNVDINKNSKDDGYIVFTLENTDIGELSSLDMWWIIAHDNGTEDYSDDFCKDNKFNIILDNPIQ